MLPPLQVPLLLKDMHIEMRTLGAELLAVFTRVQSQVDCQLDAIQVHLPQVGCPRQQSGRARLLHHLWCACIAIQAKSSM
jgi:hypothetical protein